MIRYQITDGSAAIDEQAWLSRLREDVDFIQIRERELSAGSLARLVLQTLRRVTGPRILVNDRADIAVACGAHGVHLRSGSIPPGVIKQLGSLIVSVSCHNGQDAERAEQEGADYCLLAPVFRPLSKSDSREPLGLRSLREITLARSIPVLALGGITSENIQQCLQAGAHGVAGITLFR